MGLTERLLAFFGAPRSAKLDLARACIDIGDNGQARSLLRQVVEEGTEGQKVQAKALLNRFGWSER